MNILGIAGQNRNASAALIRDGRVFAAIEEEKLSRIPNVGIAGCGGLPYRAIEFCLNRGKIEIGDIDYVAYYTRPYKHFLRSIGFQNLSALLKPGFASFQSLPGYFVDELASLKQHGNTRRKAEASISHKARFLEIDHQMCHASAAFYASGLEKAAIAVAGNAGDLTSMALMTGQDSGIKLTAEARFPNSLGMVYTAVTAALGFGAGRENKTMWLATTGENEFSELFRDLIRVDYSGLPLVNQAYFNDLAKGQPALSEAFFRQTGLEANRKDGKIGRPERNVARSLQSRSEEVLCEILARYRVESGQENLCLAGGVALNSLANAAIERKAGYRRVFVEPAPGNAGCSIGAALYIWHVLLGGKRPTDEPLSLLLGPEYGDEVIKGVLDNCKLSYKYPLTEDRHIDNIAHLLARGGIVGMFRGPMEFGPRALGSRCILASPATEIMRDNLNQYIKHREEFRPFSVAIPQERFPEFFDPSDLTDFLQGVCTVKPEKRPTIPAAVFGNGMARVHSVRREQNPYFWKLLVKFGQISGTPVLLSTSFNLFGEPFVCSPREAVRGFYSSGLDCLAIGSFLVEK